VDGTAGDENNIFSVLFPLSGKYVGSSSCLRPRPFFFVFAGFGVLFECACSDARDPKEKNRGREKQGGAGVAWKWWGGCLGGGRFVALSPPLPPLEYFRAMLDKKGCLAISLFPFEPCSYPWANLSFTSLLPIQAHVPVRCAFSDHARAFHFNRIFFATKNNQKITFIVLSEKSNTFCMGGERKGGGGGGEQRELTASTAATVIPARLLVKQKENKRIVTE
jgi:hypothetical protein